MNLFFAFAVVLLLALGVLYGTPSPSFTMAQPDGDNVNNENAPAIPQHIVPTDQTTWPQGDRIWDCCRAVAVAEGYYVAGSNPARLNNPGDISDGADTYGSEFHGGSNITKFPSANVGWQWLYTKLKRAASGQSAVYGQDMSWNEIGAIWAPPNATVWASNVAKALGVDPDSSISDYVNG